MIADLSWSGTAGPFHTCTKVKVEPSSINSVSAQTSASAQSGYPSPT